jgi:2-octaprenyl-6-methoxyphenol hydroxylase
VKSPVANRYDIAIIGGGLVGASLACALEPLGLKIALLEAVPVQAASQPSYDDRTLALSASSCKILQGLGTWPALSGNATPIREIQVREYQRPGRVIMAPAELGLDRFGHVVEARVFGAAVMQQVSRIGTLDFLCPVSVTAVTTDGGSARIEYSSDGDTHQIEAALLVGADGANSFVRDSLGIEVERHDYRQTAVICNITPEQDHRGRAFECFTPTGPFAVMPHVEGRCGLIWCVSTGQAAEMMDLPDAEFLHRAQQRFGNHLGRFLKIGQRSSYPLRLVRALEDVRPGVVILGNAAHAIHPVGAQGFNLGLRDVAVLAELLWNEAKNGTGADFGNMNLLNRYSSWRKQDQNETIAYSDGLARFFSNPSRLAAAARTAGMLAHGFIPALRRQLAVRAMGFRGHIPRLAMGEPLRSL